MRPSGCSVMVVKLCQPTRRRSIIWPLRRRPKSKNSTASSLGSEGWVLVRRQNSSLIRFSALGGAQRLPLRNRKGGKGEEFVAGFLEAGADGLATQLPLAGKSNPRVFDDLAALGVNTDNPHCEFPRSWAGAWRAGSTAYGWYNVESRSAAIAL